MIFLLSRDSRAAAAFTAAWVIGTRRQPGYAAAHEHISGLAAPDAEAPLT